jgi:hypothetical protein
VGGASRIAAQDQSDETRANWWGDQLIVWRGGVWSVRALARHYKVGIAELVMRIYDGNFKE